MNISFTEKQEKYIRAQLQSGDFKNASEVVRDALRLHQVYRHKVIEELRAEIARGWDGGTSSRTASEIARDKRNALEH
jgi:antitoxin ParD1/3/4